MPQGCIELLERSGVQISGKRAVVVGRSNIVGLPAALLLQNRDATVTMVHSRTANAQKIAAGGRARFFVHYVWRGKGGVPLEF